MIGITDLRACNNVSEELDFKGRSIRAVKEGGTLWFAAPDLAYALGYNDIPLKVAETSGAIPDCCRSTGLEVPSPDIPGEPDEAVVLLSPVGVWYWTHATNAERGQALAAWTKREAARLVPEAAKDDPRTFLTLGLDAELPPYPMKYSGRKSEWLALSDQRVEWLINAPHRPAGAELSG